MKICLPKAINNSQQRRLIIPKERLNRSTSTYNAYTDTHKLKTQNQTDKGKEN